MALMLLFISNAKISSNRFQAAHVDKALDVKNLHPPEIRQTRDRSHHTVMTAAEHR